MRKFLAVAVFLTSSHVWAVATASSAPTKLNPPTVGARQSASEQIFGAQSLTGKKGQVYHASGAVHQNSPTVGGYQASSEQVFGGQPLTGKKGQVYNTSKGVRPNNPSVGGRQAGSEQLFGNPGRPAN